VVPFGCAGGDCRAVLADVNDHHVDLGFEEEVALAVSSLIRFADQVAFDLVFRNPPYSAMIRVAMKPKKPVKNYLMAVLFAVVVVVSVVLFYLYWKQPSQLQGISLLATFAITVVLALVTWQYAQATDQMVAVMQEQFKSQQAVHIRFGLKLQDHRARVWVRNLGTAHFMITKAVIRNDDGKTETLYMHMVVAPERKAGFFIPDSLWERHSIFCDVNVKLYYESATQPEASQSRAYNLLIGLSGKQVIKIYKGVKRWYAGCPQCRRNNTTGFNNGEFNRMIDTQGLTSFEEAEARQKEAESEFEESHPNHKSKWEADIESVREQNRTEQVEDE